MTALHCLGKLPAVHDPRTVRLADLIHTSLLPHASVAKDWTNGMPSDLGMMRNDTIGDCAYAGPAHLVQGWTHNALGTTTTISDADVVAAYSRDTGYTPSDPSTDRGAVLLDVLNAWRTKGIGGHKIGAFVSVNHLDLGEVAVAIELFGGVLTGAMLPASAQQDVGGLWHLADPTDAGTWGGHCMACMQHRGYAPHGPGPTFITWGKRQDATCAWWRTYVDECYAIISPDWVNGTKPAPSGFNITALRGFLAQIR